MRIGGYFNPKTGSSGGSGLVPAVTAEPETPSSGGILYVQGGSLRYKDTEGVIVLKKGMADYLVSSLSFDECESHALAAAVGASDSSVTLESASSLSAPFYLRVDAETMLCTTKDGAALTVSRGAGSTSAAAHAGGATVYAYQLKDAGSAGLTWTPVGGVHVAGGKLITDGSSGYIYSSASVKLAFATGDFTVRCKFKSSSSTTNGAIIAGRPSTSAGSWVMGHNYNGSPNFNFYYYASGHNNIVTGALAATGAEKDIEIGRSSGSLHLFVDGALVKSDALTATIGGETFPLYIGCDPVNGCYTAAEYDNVTVYGGLCLHDAAFSI